MVLYQKERATPFSWVLIPTLDFFEKITIYWFLEGFGHLEKFRAPTDKKNSDPKKSKNMLKIYFFVAVSEMERFFVFGPWCTL